MMEDCLAHSARDGCPSQSYEEHIRHVIRDTLLFSRAAARYAKTDGELLIQKASEAAVSHDLGKLHTENQKVLHEANNTKPLPIHHQDAGVALLKQRPDTWLSQLAVSSHHTGLPDIPRERIRKNGTGFRDNDPETRNRVERELTELFGKHNQLVSDSFPDGRVESLQSDFPVFARILLSCLADADHTDTARHYGKYPITDNMPELLPEKRLECLNRHMEKKKSNGNSDSVRNVLRTEMYTACRDSQIRENIAVCDSPVGSGKTTAIMANLLRRAIDHGARRIFIVLPFTNIIQQSVKVYREALVLPGENPEDVVAELHHQADFESEDMRALSANWKAPIIVTTAVAFFETLASNKPSALRRLHELPGSVIFVDEAHAAVPVCLLPVTWKWISTLADSWSCYWVLASGSLVRFWEIPELIQDGRTVPQLVPDELRKKLHIFENQRVIYKYREKRLYTDELVDWVITAPGPRLVIMNTVKSAAFIAGKMAEKYGKDHVLHLSTALKAEDRKITVDKVNERLKNKQDTDWTLVATSCVEAGVDFDFQTGFREMSSLLSLLQTAGRINRSGNADDAEIWSFRMRDDDPMTEANPALEDSARILEDYFTSGTEITPVLSTDAIVREIGISPVGEKAKAIVKAEQNGCFPQVCEDYRIIDNDSVLAVVDEDVKQSILHGGCDWKVLQKRAVSISRWKTRKYNLRELAEGVYDWNLGYSSFLGIMEGVWNQDAFLAI